MFNVGGWLTHGDFALEAGADFLAVVEHRLVPAGVRSEWSRLRRGGISSIWAPACQDSSHVGNDVQLALTEQLFDAALAELAVVSPCLLAGDFNVEPTKIPCLSKGISAGLWVDLGAAWSATQGRHPAVTCKRSWVSTGGGRRDFLVGCPLATAALLSCSVSSCR